MGTPLKFEWNKCKLETISFGHGIAITPLQAAAFLPPLVNGGYLIKPTIIKKQRYQDKKRIISTETSEKINVMLRKVVTDKEGTASLADIYGYDVGGKTGTHRIMEIRIENLNTFISVFPSKKPKYVLLVMLLRILKSHLI